MRYWVLILVATGSAFAEPDERTLDTDFEQFLAWFPGRYDNALQVSTQNARALADDDRNYRRHSIFRRVELPTFGPVVFYAEQYRDGDPANIYRQRIYVLSKDHDRGAIRLRVHIPDDAAALAGAYRDPALLAHLSPAATTVWDGCDVFWQYRDDRFEGSLDPGTCQFDSAAFGERVQLEETLTLFKDALWFADRGLSLDGRYLFGMRGSEPAKALRAYPMTCSLDNKQSFWSHDQGGSFRATTGDATYRITTQRVTRADGDTLLLSAATAGRPLLIATGTTSNVATTLGAATLDCFHDNGRLYEEGAGQPTNE